MSPAGSTPRAGAEYDAHYYGANYERATGHPYRWGEPVWHGFFGHVAGRIIDELAPARVLDAGCAIGFLVGALRARGVDAKGIDVSAYAISQVPLALRDHCRVGSLADPIEGRYDLVTCIEILEHIPEALAETTIGNLCRVTDTVLFSSSPDDESEATHVNVRAPTYWDELFERQGFGRTTIDVRTISPQATVYRRGAPGGPPRAPLRASTPSPATPARSHGRAVRLRETSLGRQGARAGRLAWWTVTLQLRERLSERRTRLELDRQRGHDAYRLWVSRYDELDEADLDAARRLGEELPWRPLVSIVMPVFDPPVDVLERAIDSVRTQTYAHWQLCLADDASTDPRVFELLDRVARLDPRIEVVHRPENGGISAASNTALEMARGELVGFVDHDDVLRPHALTLMVKAFADGADVGWAYSDEDVLTPEGERERPYFKPDWSPTLLCGQNVLSHFSITRTALVREVGGFRSELEGSQDWDLALRVTERLAEHQVVHVPHVLYHWRMIQGSAASEAAAKPYALEAGRRATLDHLVRLGVSDAGVTGVGTHHRVSFPPARPPDPVAVVVPTSGSPDRVAAFLGGLLEKTLYEPLEIVLVVDPHRLAGPVGDALREVVADRAALVAGSAGPFNFADACNRGAAATTSPFVLLLNDDVEPITPDWLHTMVGQARRPGVGAVGALLLYPGTNRVQHAGVLVGTGHAADHLYRGRTVDGGYFNRQLLPQELSAVTGACMLLGRDAFEAVEGLDPAFGGAYNDVDLCLRLRRHGWRVVYEPGAVLHHHEGATFGTHSHGREEAYQQEVELMLARWGDALARDPFHNPNLALEPTNPGWLAFPPRDSYPWRAVPGSSL